MYRIHKEGIEKKIIASRFSEDEDVNKSIRSALLAIMEELCRYTDKAGMELMHRVRDRDRHYQIGDIYTALLAVGDEDANKAYEAAGLYKMAETNPLKRVFLDCEYDEIRSIVGDLSQKKIYQGRYIKDGKPFSFDYRLEFDPSFLRAQERLFDYAEQYCVKNPIIFSPYSHKSFFVRYDENLDQDELDLDFCFADNHIPVVAGDCCLYWNIRESAEDEKTYDAKEPYGEKTKYIYTFSKTKKGNVLLPMPVNQPTRIYEIHFAENGVEVITGHDIESFVIYEYVDLDFHSEVVKERQSKGFLFGNGVDEGLQEKRRLLSEGDIERAIGSFRAWQGMRCERADGEGDPVIRYAKKYCAHRGDKNLFHPIRREYIHFKKADKKFLADYANYVLAYLEYHYPEIEWAGET